MGSEAATTSGIGNAHKCEYQAWRYSESCGHSVNESASRHPLRDTGKVRIKLTNGGWAGRRGSLRCSSCAQPTSAMGVGGSLRAGCHVDRTLKTNAVRVPALPESLFGIQCGTGYQCEASISTSTERWLHDRLNLLFLKPSMYVSKALCHHGLASLTPVYELSISTSLH